MFAFRTGRTTTAPPAAYTMPPAAAVAGYRQSPALALCPAYLFAGMT